MFYLLGKRGCDVGLLPAAHIRVVLGVIIEQKKPAETQDTAKNTYQRITCYKEVLAGVLDQVHFRASA